MRSRCVLFLFNCIMQKKQVHCWQGIHGECTMEDHKKQSRVIYFAPLGENSTLVPNSPYSNISSTATPPPVQVLKVVLPTPSKTVSDS